MGIYSKEVYEGKKRYALEKMSKNAEIAKANGMSDEQVSALEELCSFRHELHSTSVDRLYSSDSPDLYKFSKIIDETSCEGNTIRDIIFELFGDYPFDLVDLEYELLGDLEIDELAADGTLDDEDDDEKYKIHDKHMDVLAEQIQKINNEIEKFLLKIDKQYNTSYCPTGFSRLV